MIYLICSNFKNFETTYVLVTKVEHYVVIMTGISYKPSFKEGNVENGRIEIDKLEDEDFESQIVIKLGLRSVHF